VRNAWNCCRERLIAGQTQLAGGLHPVVVPHPLVQFLTEYRGVLLPHLSND